MAFRSRWVSLDKSVLLGSYWHDKTFVCSLECHGLYGSAGPRGLDFRGAPYGLFPVVLLYSVVLLNLSN